MEGSGDKAYKITDKLRENVKKIPEYVPGKSIEEVKRRFGLSKVVKLASNENPYGASPKAIEAFRRFDRFHIYPSESEQLIEKISEYIGVEKERIVLGAGIDGVLENIFKMFVDPGDEVVIPIPSFPYYHTLASVCDAKEIRVKRGSDFKIDENAIIESVTDKTKIIIICSPNNPTGNSEDYDAVKAIVESCNALVFIDEAYAEFASRSLIDLAEYENVVVARTFSKAFGLANLRIGYAVMSPELKKAYMKVTTPFPISTPAILAAIASLEDIEYMKACVEKIRSERDRLYNELKSRVNVYPSEANFLFFESPLKASELAEELMKKGVIVRDCSRFIGCSPYAIRVSIGKKEENDAFLEALDDVLSGVR